MSALPTFKRWKKEEAAICPDTMMNSRQLDLSDITHIMKGKALIIIGDWYFHEKQNKKNREKEGEGKKIIEICVDIAHVIPKCFKKLFPCNFTNRSMQYCTECFQ